MVGNRAGPHTKSVVYRHNEVNIAIPPPPQSGYSLVSHTLTHETMADGAGTVLKSRFSAD